MRAWESRTSAATAATAATACRRKAGRTEPSAEYRGLETSPLTYSLLDPSQKSYANQFLWRAYQSPQSLMNHLWIWAGLMRSQQNLIFAALYTILELRKVVNWCFLKQRTWSEPIFPSERHILNSVPIFQKQTYVLSSPCWNTWPKVFSTSEFSDHLLQPQFDWFRAGTFEKYLWNIWSEASFGFCLFLADFSSCVLSSPTGLFTTHLTCHLINF